MPAGRPLSTAGVYFSVNGLKTQRWRGLSVTSLSFSHSPSASSASSSFLTGVKPEKGVERMCVTWCLSFSHCEWHLRGARFHLHWQRWREIWITGVNSDEVAFTVIINILEDSRIKVKRWKSDEWVSLVINAWKSWAWSVCVWFFHLWFEALAERLSAALSSTNCRQHLSSWVRGMRQERWSSLRE